MSSSKIKAIHVEKIVTLSDSITRPANTTTYAAGDALSDATADELFTLTSRNDISALTAEITRARLLSSAYVATGPGIDLLIFTQKPDTTADNAPVAITDAQMLNCIAVAKFASGSWSGRGNQIQFVDLDAPFRVPLSGGSFNLYAQAVLTNGYVPVSGEVFTLDLDIRLNA